jgi:ComF family protein
MLLAALFDLIFPPRCVACLKIIERGRALCSACRASISLHQNFFCGSCRGRLPCLPDGAIPRSHCHPGFPYTLGAAADYRGAVKALVHALKFQGVRDAAAELGNLIADELGAFSTDALAIVPIPLSRRRRYERGYNQAELIARALSERLALPILSALVRTRETDPQSQVKGLHERRENVAGCFILGAPSLTGTVFLVDDVATSGATLEEAALVLKAAGVRRVIALVAAKA